MIISISPIKQMKLAHKKSTTYQGHTKEWGIPHWFHVSKSKASSITTHCLEIISESPAPHTNLAPCEPQRRRTQEARVWGVGASLTPCFGVFHFFLSLPESKICSSSLTSAHVRGFLFFKLSSFGKYTPIVVISNFEYAWESLWEI